MKKRKYLLPAIIALVVLFIGWLIYRHHQVASDARRINTAYSELLSERKGLQQGALSCQEYTLEGNSDFPAILNGKSVDQIKTLILQQPALC